MEYELRDKTLPIVLLDGQNQSTEEDDRRVVLMDSLPRPSAEIKFAESFEPNKKTVSLVKCVLVALITIWIWPLIRLVNIYQENNIYMTHVSFLYVSMLTLTGRYPPTIILYGFLAYFGIAFAELKTVLFEGVRGFCLLIKKISKFNDWERYSNSKVPKESKIGRASCRERV